MFIASKFFAVLTQPLAWVAALLLLSLLVPQRAAWDRRLVVAALTLLLAMGWLPLPEALIRTLESQYAEVPPQTDLRGFAGMVVLGGSTEPGYVAQAHAQPLLNEAAERMTAPLAMLHRNPHLRLVYTGGEGDWLGTGLSEAERARVFFTGIGLPPERVEYESASRTTHENAVLAARLPGVDIHQRWLLVTTASHMPRAMATFTKTGWNVTAYPVDFRTGSATPWTAYSLKDGARKWQLALHELAGIVAYRLTGRL
ncbi:MAG: YdcF family protein [Burkholderiales bacterium]|nr:YdcF family protein [Burkholderiales bacterium]